MTPATHIDLYQLSSLVPHVDAEMGDSPVAMSFFSRRLPLTPHDRQPVRGFLLWVGLRRILQHLEHARFDGPRIDTLLAHPMLGPTLKTRPELVERFRAWRFRGRILSPPEGTPVLAGRAVDLEGRPLDVNGVRPSAQCPYLVVETDLFSAKLIETPLLSIINHMTMVASKAARVVLAAGDRGVLEFGQRRTHPEAAVDAAYAAWIAGCVGSSNVEAHHRWGVPVAGTMDHFAIQAWERPDRPRHETESAYFRAFYEAYPASSFLLVDTYDTYGENTGIRAVVRATQGRLTGIRLDSNLTIESIREARRILDEQGAPQAKIAVSGGIDEYKVQELAGAPVDLFGVGERIVTSPDAPVGVGAVGKLCLIEGRPTMKLSRGSGKATLPGLVQVWEEDGHQVIGLRGERPGGLLQPVWEGESPLPLPSAEETRAYTLSRLHALTPEQRRPRQVEVPVTPALCALIEELANAL